MADDLGFEPLSEEELGFEAAPLPPEPESMGRSLVRGALGTLPIVGGIGGGALGTSLSPAGTVAAGALGYAGGKQLERLGQKYLLGEDDAVAPSVSDQAIQTGGDLAEGAVGGMVGGIASKAIPAVGRGLSARGRKIAEFLAERASKVKDPAPGTGRILLDEGVVRPFSTSGGIQANAQVARERIGRELGDILNQVPGTTPGGPLVSELDELARNYSLVPGAESKTKLLSQISKNVQGSPTQDYSAAALEQAKRNFAKKAGYGKANRSFPAEAYGDAAGVFRRATERLVDEAQDPILKQAFMDKKAAFGPVADIADRGKSFTSLMGQLADKPGIKDAVMGRLGSTAAVATDSASKIFESAGRAGGSVGTALGYSAAPASGDAGQAIKEQATPMIRKVLDAMPEVFGKYAPVLQRAAESGNSSLATTDFLLQQKDPEYQRLKKSLNER